VSDHDDIEVPEVVLEQWLIEDLDRLEQIKLTIASLEAEKDDLQASITKELLARQIKEVPFTDHNGDHVTATVVSGVNRTLDLAKLEKIDIQLYELVTKTVPDTTKIKKAESMGLFSGLDHVFVSKPKTPYVLFTPANKEEATNE
jgi:hypothetical protein